jgi:uncharacterized protein YjlB
MYLLETLKKTLETVTGIGRPSARSAQQAVRDRKAHETMFKDDGAIPNNPKLPFIHYRSPIDLPDAGDPAALFEELFKRNGWGDAWRNGIYDYVHFHSSTHEVLGVACGRASVRFGGNKGKTFELRTGDVVILPRGYRPSMPLRERGFARDRSLSAGRQIRRMHGIAARARARIANHPKSTPAGQGSGVRRRRPAARRLERLSSRPLVNAFPASR